MPKTRLDPLDIPLDILPHLCLLDVLDGGEFRFRLFGTGLVHGYGRELTGKLLRDSFTGEPMERVYALYRSVVDGREPSVTRVCFDTDHGPVAYDRAVIPLCDDQGRVRWLLVALDVLQLPVARTVLDTLGAP